MTNETKAFIGSVLAIAFGVALLWLPPPQLAGQTATVGLAIAFAAGGFAGLGVSISAEAGRVGAERALARQNAAKPRATRKRASTPPSDKAPTTTNGG